MLATQAGDARSYEFLLGELARAASAYARGRLADPGLAEDFAQELLLSVHRARHTFRPDKLFAPWFFGIVRHRFIDFLRAEGRRPLTYDAETALDLVATRDPDWTTVAAIHEAITRLPAKQQTALRMRLERRPVSEIALALNLRVPAAKVAIHRARKALKKLLREQYEFD